MKRTTPESEAKRSSIFDKKHVIEQIRKETGLIELSDSKYNSGNNFHLIFPFGGVLRVVESPTVVRKPLGSDFAHVVYYNNKLTVFYDTMHYKKEKPDEGVPSFDQLQEHLKQLFPNLNQREYALGTSDPKKLGLDKVKGVGNYRYCQWSDVRKSDFVIV